MIFLNDIWKGKLSGVLSYNLFPLPINRLATCEKAYREANRYIRYRTILGKMLNGCVFSTVKYKIEEFCTIQIGAIFQHNMLFRIPSVFHPFAACITMISNNS